ncbi:MAG: hypothetical protein ABIN25_07070 [Ginsengibacter sp.]
MNCYYSFYCRAYDWYNTTGKKNKDTLRGSAIALISGLPLFNILTIIGFISVINKHTLINKWVGLAVALISLLLNSLFISSDKSDVLRQEYLLLDEKRKKKIKIFFYYYLIISILLLIVMFIYTAYYKNKYGNYDL